jgi:glycine dehydrogenase
MLRSISVIKNNLIRRNFCNFVKRHIGPNDTETTSMLQTINCNTLEEMTSKIIPKNIIRSTPTSIGEGLDENIALQQLKEYANKNDVKYLSLIGMGYHGTITPPVILRNVLENPDWYTPYTPYQAEISQGRL